MTTAATSDMTVPLFSGRSHFLFRRLHSLTGLLFGGYILVHLFINATLVQLGGVYQAQVDKIHGMPMLVGIEWGLIFLPILYHGFYGLYITLTGQPNANRYVYLRNWWYLVQRVTAVILVFFIAFHVLALKYGLLGSALSFDPTNAAATVAQHLKAAAVITWVIYPVGIACAAFHLANGFWAAAITWGLTISAGAQRRFGYICVLIFLAAFVLGITALVAGVTLHQAPVTLPVRAVAGL